jgi:hypothetical protein
MATQPQSTLQDTEEEVTGPVGPTSVSLEDLSALGHTPDDPSAKPATGPVTVSLLDLTALGHEPDKPPLTMQQAQEAGTQGFIGRGGSMLAGTAGFIAGAKATAPLMPAATPFLGPATIAIPFLGGTAGAVLSYTGAKTLADSLIDEPEPDSPAYIHYEMGATLGESIALAPLAFFIPQSLAFRLGRVGPFISRIGEGARKYPKSYLLGEATAGASSAVGTGIAISEFEDDPMARFLLETAGGVFDPVRFVPLATSKGFDFLRTGWQLRNAEGRAAFKESQSQATKDKATARILKILEESGEDVPELIKRLESPLLGSPDVAYPPGRTTPKTGPTSAQKTGSLVLAQIEATLSALDPKFAADVTEQGKQSLKAFSLLLTRLNEAGSPEALRTAAVMRQDFFNSALQSRLDRALTRANERIEDLFIDRKTREPIFNQQEKIRIGRIYDEEIRRAEENAREAERIFWEEAERQALTPVGTQKITEVVPSGPEIKAAYDKAAEEMLTQLRTSQRKYGQIDFNNARQVSRLTGIKAVSLSQYIKQKLGGIALSDEWRARDLNGRTRPGLFLQDTPANRSKAGMDSLREVAFDGGYFPGKTDYNEITDDELISAVESDTPTNRLWQASVREQLADARAVSDELMEMSDAYGIRPDMSVQQIANRMRAEDDALRNQGLAERFVSPGKQRKVTRTVDKPNVLVPSRFADVYLKRGSTIGDALLDDPEFISGSAKKILKAFGLTKEMVQRYKAGKNTEKWRSTGTMDPRFLPRPGAIKEIPVSELIRYRSSLLKLARDARAGGSLEKAGLYSTLAEALLDDLSTLPGEAYDVARSFSRSLNDTFTRTFVGDVLGTKSSGAVRYPADTLVEDAFGVGADRAALRMLEIENAIGFLQRELTDARVGGVSRFEDTARLSDLADISTDGIVSIQDAQNRVLRLLASKSLIADPKRPGQFRVNTRRLNQFVADYKPLLDKMGLTGELQNAAQAENLLAAVMNQNSRLNKKVRAQMAFSRLTGVESPTTAVANALSPNNPFPVRSMRELANLARKAGPEAMAGLKAAIYDYVGTKASGGTSALNSQVYYDAFFKKYAVDQPELASVLRLAGIMTPEELKNVRALIDQMRIVEDAMANRTQIENFLQGADVIGELAMRVTGSQIGTAASGGGPGALIAASAGSKAIRQIFDKMPMAMVRELIQEAAQNPQLLAQLLRRGMSEREKLVFARRLNGYLIAAGLNYSTYEPPPEEQQTRAAPGAPGSAASDLQNLQSVYDALRGNKPQPPAPSTRGMPGMPGGAPPAGGPPAGGGAPPTTQSRMMLQQLFPFDPITGAAAVQAGMPPMVG